MSRVRRRFLANRGAVVGAVLLAILVLIAVAAPVLSAKDPLAGDVEHGLSALGAPLPPSGDAVLGTDQLGRDVWARVVAATQSSLIIAGLATLLAVAIGAAIGLVAAYAGGVVDSALMQLVDLVLAFPFVLLAILLAALFREADLASSSAPVILTLGVVGWTQAARMVRARARVLVHSVMVVAARAIGAGPVRIILGCVLPNLAGIVIVVTTIAFAQNLLSEAVLSYLGLGPPPPAPSWGRMLYEGRAYYRTAPHLVLMPGIAIFIAVTGVNLIGEGLRDALDTLGAHDAPDLRDARR
jgi:peptide/nickel transport system permease protein